jgi:hypothetical protein
VLSGLVEQKVSVTCYVGVGGRAEWFLTKESGRAPRCSGTGEDCERCGQGVPVADALVGTYVVIQVARALCTMDRFWSEVLVARLTADAVSTVQVFVEEEYMNDDSIVSMVDTLERGGYSAEDGCLCRYDLICRDCSGVEPEERRFMCATVFASVLPYGVDHWWRGVTDATRPVAECGDEWLQCPAEWVRLGFLHACLWGMPLRGSAVVGALAYMDDERAAVEDAVISSEASTRICSEHDEL